MASRCVGCQNRDAAIADLTKEVERLREALADAENCHRTSDQWRSHYQTKLARLVDGLDPVHKAEILAALDEDDSLTFVSHDELCVKLAEATGEGK